MSTETSGRTRDGLRGWVRAHPRMAGGVAALLVAGIVIVLVWFQPQVLLFDSVVDDDFPAAATAPATTEATREPEPDPVNVESDAAPGDEEDAEPPEAVETVEPSGPIAVATGEFASRNRYTVTGTATAFELEDGSRTLRLEDFESTNGPDLYVYLTAADHADSDDALDADVVDLGRLRGNVGNQNYEIPAEVDLDHYDTVVIWCLRFATSFGAADLTSG